jgi:hypothetical protein
VTVPVPPGKDPTTVASVAEDTAVATAKNPDVLVVVLTVSKAAPCQQCCLRCLRLQQLHNVGQAST